MKIYLEGSVEEIEQFLYGGDEAEEECDCDDCECVCDKMTPAEQMKRSLIDAINAALNVKPQG